MINHTEVLHARNRVKLQHKTYLYEGMKNIIFSKGFTVSEFMFACTLMAIEKMNNRKLEYVKESNRLILTNYLQGHYALQVVGCNFTLKFDWIRHG